MPRLSRLRLAPAQLLDRRGVPVKDVVEDGNGGLCEGGSGARGREGRSLGVTSSAPSATFVNRVVQARVDDAISPGPGTPRDLFLPFLLWSSRCSLKLPNLFMAWEWAQRSSSWNQDRLSVAAPITLPWTHPSRRDRTCVLRRKGAPLSRARFPRVVAGWRGSLDCFCRNFSTGNLLMRASGARAKRRVPRRAFGASPDALAGQVVTSTL